MVEFKNINKNSEKSYFSYIGGVDSFIETHDFTLVNKEVTFKTSISIVHKIKKNAR